MTISLRTLLDIKEPRLEKNDDGNLLPRHPLKGYNTLWIPVTGSTSSITTSDASSYHRTCYPQWTIPTGTTDVIFEIWGGGGSGASGCCCHYGPPGGAGAYAYKRLCGTEVVPGCAYDISIGRGTDEPTSCAGVRGCKTYIQGWNLTNFCAEGGHPGATFCHNNVTAQHWTRSNESTCTFGCCALYYGADKGAIGLPSYLHPRGGASARCCSFHGFAYPGGLVNSKGGWITHRFLCHSKDSNRCETVRASSTVGIGGGYCFGYTPGFPGATHISCDNTHCYGTPGMAGMARISWK